MFAKNTFRLILIIIVLFTNLYYAGNGNSELNLMPVPQQLIMSTGKFRITGDLKIEIKGEPDQRLYPAATRALRRLDARTGLFFRQDHITPESDFDSCNVIIECAAAGKIELGQDESYNINISEDMVRIKAPNDLGAMHGLETLLQLLNADSEGYFFPCLTINDKPRFPWRGLLIDVCRHFMPVDVLKRNLDGLAAVKMNVFHWHLSEDQGFRVESKIYPKLHDLGSDGFYYTQEQVKDVIKYAADRGIRVIPEFDVPGHATSWFVGYPELASAPGPYTIERGWGIKDPTFNPAIEETYTFLDNLFGEMAALFPDEYFHIGGDENNGKQWDANEQIQEFMKENDIEDNHQLQAYFNNRVLKILTKHGKKMVGWDEILHKDMPTNIVIQSWRGKEALIKSAQQGYMGILSNGYYIDLIQPASFHYLNDPLDKDSPLTEEECKRILGGEATSWAELVTPETVDSRIWPRTAAIAERLWSPREVTDLDDMYKRLERISYLLEEHGLLHIKNYRMMLRRLTDNNDITALKILVDVVEPVRFYQRHFQGVKYTQYSPYTRIVDAARPESMTARNFSILVDNYLTEKDDASLKMIIQWLEKWRSNYEELKATMNLSPIVREIEPLSINLQNISLVGLEALQLIKQNNKAPFDWIDKAGAMIEEAKKPYGQVELRIVDPIEKLVEFSKQ